MKKLSIGILFIFLGLIFLAINLGLLPYSFGELFQLYWPAILVFIGFINLLNALINAYKRFDLSDFFTSALLIIIGGVLLGNRLNWFNNRYISIWQVLWPILIVFIGISFLKPSNSFIQINTQKKQDESRIFDKDEVPPNNQEDNSFKDRKRRKISSNTVIGYTEFGSEPWVLEDGSISVGIGGTVLDMTKAFIKDGETKLKVAGTIGSIELYIPSTIAVDITAALSLGNVELFNESYSGTPGTITYTSNDYDGALKRVKLNVALNIGEIVIKQVE